MVFKKNYKNPQPNKKKNVSMKAVGVSDFVLKARGKLAAAMHVTNAEIFILKFKKLLFFLF